MTEQPALRVHIDGDGAAVARAGYLSMGAHAAADVPYRPGEDFPFEDRAVDGIICGGFIHALARAARVRLLLECRRSLKPGGRLEVARDPTGTAREHQLARDAALVGLDAVAPLAFAKRDRILSADALVSIVIPAYNPRFFPAALDSALAQSYGHVEIVVCDDSPGPEIEQVARASAPRFPIRYERNATRLGPRGNFTRCFERASGEFVKFLCDDDLLAPGCVASLLDAFGQAPDVTLATSARLRIDESGLPIDDQPATVPIVAADSLIAGYSLANAMLTAGLNFVGEPSTALFRKGELADRAPEYFRFEGEAGHGVIDMVTWTALLLKGDAVYLRERLSSFRIHPGQRQHDPAKAQRNADSIRGLQAAWLRLGLHERLRSDALVIKPFPPQEAVDWREEPMLGFAARPIASRAGSNTLRATEPRGTERTPGHRPGIALRAQPGLLTRRCQQRSCQKRRSI